MITYCPRCQQFRDTTTGQFVSTRHVAEMIVGLAIKSAIDARLNEMWEERQQFERQMPYISHVDPWQSEAVL